MKKTDAESLNQNGKTCEVDRSAQDVTKETRCGFLGIDSEWMQKLASKKVFILVYGLLGMNQAALGSYYVATITTMEKRFKLPSTYSGIVTSAWDVGSLLATMCIAYFGGAGHKTRWVSYWALVASLSCFIRLIPHWMYGPGEDTYKAGLTEMTILNKTVKDPLCLNSNQEEENCSLNHEGTVVFFTVIVTQLLLGVGTSAYYTLGAAYLDDNVMSSKFPFLYAVASCLRYIGPTWGYLLASYTLSIYINIDVTPNFGVNDSRWVGAWYLGWVPLGIVEAVMALAIAFFPRTLPREAIRRQNSNVDAKSSATRSFKDFVKTVKRLLSNPILMYNTFSTTFYIFGFMGYWIFMPKYIETQFRKSASEASVITGAVGLVCAALGILTSGAVVSRLKPSPRALAFWNLMTETADVLGSFAYGFIGCQKNDLQGFIGDNGKWDFNTMCNSQCSCAANIPFTPVCSDDGTQMFFSACHAGCLGVQEINGTKLFTDCACIAGSGIAKQGFCPIDCDQQFYAFLALLCFLRFFSATGRAGNTIIQYRSVAPEDKSVSIAFTEMVLCAVTFIPAPIIFGIIVDSTCQVWGYTCGERGNCLLYFGNDIRYLLNFTSCGFIFVGLLLDIGVFCNVGSLKIYEDEEGTQTQQKVKFEDMTGNDETEMRNREPLLELDIKEDEESEGNNSISGSEEIEKK